MAMDKADARMSKMATYYLWITSASGPATCLLRENTRDEVTGHLATLPYQHILHYPSLADGGSRMFRKYHRRT
jgi:hypothetical protein